MATGIKASVKKINDCKVRLNVEVEANVVENRFQDVFRDFQKMARLPGFRPGKAPKEMVEKQFEKEAHEEVLKSLIPEAYHQSVISQNVSPVSMPKISEVKMERGKKLTFQAELEKTPDFSVKNYKNIKLKRESSEVSSQDLEKGIKGLLDSKADLVPIVETREIQKGDFIVTDIDIWKDGAYVSAKKGVLLHVEPGEQDNFFDQVIGAKVDEAREVTMKPVPGKEEKDGKQPHYKIWVRGIKEKKLPELNDEFAKAFGKESVQDLKEAIQKDLANYKHSEALSKMKKELYEKLLTLAQFTIPEGLVERQKQRYLENAKGEFTRMGLSGQRLDDEMKKVDAESQKRSEEQVKLYFVLSKIADQEDIHEDEMELEKRIQEIANEHSRSLEEVKKVFEDDLRESMREAKTVDFLIANAKFDELKTN